MRKTQMEYPKFPAILTSLSIPLVNSLKYPNVGFESTFTENSSFSFEHAYCKSFLETLQKLFYVTHVYYCSVQELDCQLKFEVNSVSRVFNSHTRMNSGSAPSSPTYQN